MRTNVESSSPPVPPAPLLPASDDDVIDLTLYHHSDRGGGLYDKVDAFIERLDLMRARGLYLWKARLDSAGERTATLSLDGEPAREKLLLSSNSYLGLATHPRVVEAHAEAARRYGTGSGSAPFFSGTYQPHRALESDLARRKHAQDCCLFSSGYAANLGVITALIRPGDQIFIDRLVHASIVDGVRASGGIVRVVRHNDPLDLDRKLLRYGRGGGGKLVIADAVYSMDGDIAPLPELLAVTRRHGAILLIDEAHSTAVLGRTGAGLAEHFALDHAGADDLLVVGTLSKALASQGGFFAGPRKVVEYVRHYARSAMFSTALSPSAPAAALAALSVLDDEPWRLDALRDNAAALRNGLRAAGLRVGPSESPVIPVIVGAEGRLVTMARLLIDRDVHVNCVFYPAVSRTDCRLRLSVMATHTPADILRAVSEIVRVDKETRATPPALAAAS